MFYGRLIALITYCVSYLSSAPLTGPNVCRNLLGVKIHFYCCFNHYYWNGQCKACDPGTTSTDGKNCYPCPHNTHGNACKHTCNCNLNEKCDQVLGCISTMVSSKMTTEPPLFDTVWTNTYGSALYTIQIDNKSNYSTSPVSVERTPDSSHQKHNPEESITLVHYFVIAGGIVGWCVFCFAVIRFIYRRSKRKPHKTSGQPSVRIQESSPDRTSEIPTESIYDIIEDIPTPEVTIQKSNSYLSVVGSEISQDNVAEDNKTECLFHNSEINRSDKTLSSTTASSDGSQCSEIETQIDGYLHPYALLAHDNRGENTYSKSKDNDCREKTNLMNIQ